MWKNSESTEKDKVKLSGQVLNGPFVQYGNDLPNSMAFPLGELCCEPKKRLTSLGDIKKVLHSRSEPGYKRC